MKRQLSSTNWTSAKFSVSSSLSGFAFKARLSFSYFLRLVKVYSPEESGRIVDHETSSGNYETTSSKLTDENAKCRVEFERSYIFVLLTACSRMQQDCENYSVKVRKTKLLSLVLLRAQETISEQALH